MNFLLLLFFLEFGYAPYYDSLNTQEYLRDENIYYVTLDAEVIFLKYGFVGGSVKTYVHDIRDSYTYHPFEADYMFRAGFRFKNIEIGFRHLCLHPVRPFEMVYNTTGSTDGGYEEFYIRISNGL